MKQHESSCKCLIVSSLSLLACLAATPLSLAGGTAAAETLPLTNEERIAVETLAGLGEAVIYHKLVHGSYPEPFNQLIPLVDLGETLSALVEGSTHRDPWGQPILYWSDGMDYALVSYGADAVPDQEYTDLTTGQFTTDDLVWVNEDFAKAPRHFQPAITLGKQKRTMADLRSIAICFQAYRIDNGSIPGSSGEFVSVESFRDHFQPIYIRTLPLVDGWGNPIVVLSDGDEHYTIVSTGEDGVREGNYEEAPAARRPDAASADIVMKDGFFVQWPAGIAQ